MFLETNISPSGLTLYYLPLYIRCVYQMIFIEGIKQKHGFYEQHNYLHSYAKQQRNIGYIIFPGISYSEFHAPVLMWFVLFSFAQSRFLRSSFSDSILWILRWYSLTVCSTESRMSLTVTRKISFNEDSRKAFKSPNFAISTNTRSCSDLRTAASTAGHAAAPLRTGGKLQPLFILMLLCDF